MGDSFSAFGDGNGFSVLGQGNGYSAPNLAVAFVDITGVTSDASSVTPGSGDSIAKPMSLENACKIWWSLNTFNATLRMNDTHFGSDNFESELPEYTTASGLARASEDCEDQSEDRTENRTVSNVTGSYSFAADLRSPHGNGAIKLNFFDDGNFNILGYGWGTLINLQANISKNTTDLPLQTGACSETRFYTNFHRTLDSSEVLSNVTINGIDFIEVKRVIGPTGALQPSNPFTISLDSFDFETYS